MKKLLIILVLCATLVGCGGCAASGANPTLTTEQKLNVLQKDFNLAEPWINLAIATGVIKGQGLINAIEQAKVGFHSAIDAAFVAVRSGGRLDAQFYYEQVVAALGRYFEFKAGGEKQARMMGLDPRKLPTTKPAVVQ